MSVQIEILLHGFTPFMSKLPVFKR